MTALPAISLEILQRVIPLIFIPFERLVALKTGRKSPANAAPKHNASVGCRHGKKPHRRQHKQRNRGMKTGSGQRRCPHCQHATASSHKAHREIRSKRSSLASRKRTTAGWQQNIGAGGKAATIYRSTTFCTLSPPATARKARWRRDCQSARRNAKINNSIKINKLPFQTCQKRIFF
jgi:hypothetical protein